MFPLILFHDQKLSDQNQPFLLIIKGTNNLIINNRTTKFLVINRILNKKKVTKSQFLHEMISKH